MTAQPAARRVKRERSASESLLSITLMLEGFLIFFAALSAFALDAVPPLTALIGGLVFILLLALTGRAVRYPSGRIVGWVLQFAIIAIGIILPLMFVIGAGFLALWAFCFVKGRSLDGAKAAHLASNPNQGEQLMTTSVEETLVLIKPDGVARNLIGEIIARIEAKGYQVVDLKLVQADRELLGAHYEEHEGKPFYEPLVSFMGEWTHRCCARRRQPRDRGLPLARRHHRPDHRRPRHHPRRPRP